jgi:hypothetical protein
MQNESKESRASASEGSVVALHYISAAVLVLLVLFVFFFHFQIGFTTRDDAEIGLYPVRLGTPETAWRIAQASGRFYHLISVPIQVALLRLFLFSPMTYNLLAVGAVLLNVALFSWVVRKAFASNLAGLLTATLSLIWLQNHWGHSLLTSYPVIPHLAFSALLCATIVLLSWERGQPFNRPILVGSLYFFSILFSELFLIYFPILAGICFYRAWQLPLMSFKARAKAVVCALWPMVAGVVLYLLCYFAFRYLHPSHHHGNQLAPFDVKRIVAVLWQYTTSTLPGYFYFHDADTMNRMLDGFAPRTGRFIELFKDCRVEWLAKALLSSCFCALLLSLKPSLPYGRHYFLAISAGVAATLAPVFLVSLTLQYQDWVVNSGSLAYGLPSYCAYFGVVLLIGTVLLYLNQLARRSNTVSLGYIVLVSLFVGTTSLATDSYNYGIALDQRLSNLKWRTLDRFIRTNDFKALPEDSLLYAPSIWQARGIASNREEYWTDYFTARSRKKISVAGTLEELKKSVAARPQGRTYFLAFRQAPKEPDQFLIFAEVKNLEPSLSGDAVYANDFALFGYSKNRRFTLIGRCSGGATRPSVGVNGKPVNDMSGDVFFALVDEPHAAGDFPRNVVHADRPVDLTRLEVSYFPEL